MSRSSQATWKHSIPDSPSTPLSPTPGFPLRLGNSSLYQRPPNIPLLPPSVTQMRSKAFDSVNHDLILDKLKNSYSIDGRLLKFLKNYLCKREQSVVLDGVKSSLKPVLSGVPQGSILGPILFVLFVNDLHEGISTNTHIALYADDTKLWRSIKNEEDITQLQRDINILYFWSLNNKMKFHPDKCKVVTIKHRPSPLAMLPFVAYHYHLGENLLSYADSEKDLGVHINKSFTFNEQCEILLTKANQKF